jgi:hypothetical protein
MNDQARVILALATENPNDAIWSRIRMLADEIFAAPVAYKFAYYGREGAGQTRRPCIATEWVVTTDDWTDIVDQARSNCVCGCFMATDDFLAQALREAQQAPVQAIVVLGGFHGKLDDAIATAKLLRAVGTRVFCFQQDRSSSTERAFRALAEIGGGAFYRINPHVDMVAERLPSMLEAVTHYATGGKAALETRDDESANLLLEQIAAADRTLARSR